MKRREKIWKRLTGAAELNAHPLPAVPIVEIAGNRRVLIENHLGVSEYGTERICALVKYGTVVIAGTSLELSYMSRHQLVVSGCIDAVSIERKGV